MSDETRKIAVLTGDLVNSTGLGPEKVERAFVALEDCAEMQAAWMGGQSLHFTRHRGDGWQVALAEPKYALRSALCFRAALRAISEEYDSYIGIAEGSVEGKIGPNLNKEQWEPFINSGDVLEICKSSRTFTHFFHAEFDAIGAAFILADAISRRWTWKQAETIFLALIDTGRVTHTEISQRLQKSRQAVTKSLEGANFPAILEALSTLEHNQIEVTNA
ncbi:hypothetical protein [Celeribacter sp.]|uniref:hypothetical protein n=1 Tax=Celeribacter sp. TaxID=1890673 RepID=UPI003A8F66B9